jgi:hypothetical protein
MEYEEYLASLEGNEDESSIETALADLDKGIDEIDNTETNEDPDNDESAGQGEAKDDESDADPDPKDEEGVDKTKQSSDENAKFAEARRQKQIDDKVAAELKRLQEESPEFKLAKTLSEEYGQPVDVIVKQIEEARLLKKAEEQKVPVEYLRRMEAESKARLELELQVTQLQFDAWTARIEREETQLKTEYPMLTDDDMFEAKTYLLKTLGRDVPLDQAIHAVHGKKIIQAFKESSKNETLAELSGRKKGALPPQGGKAPNSISLSADELYIAKQMKMSPEEYHKYKTM